MTARDTLRLTKPERGPIMESMVSEDLCAVILAGGRSRRMGSNKALMTIGGRPLIQIVIERALPLTQRILISSDEGEEYRLLGFPVVPDRYRDHGPLAGLHAAMHHEHASLYLALACDLPGVPTPLLEHLVACAEGYDAAIPRSRDGLAHPLCAVYRRSCLSRIEDALEHGARKVIATFLDGPLRIRWVPHGDGPFDDSDLANINTPGDLQRLRRRMEGETSINSTYGSQLRK